MMADVSGDRFARETGELTAQRWKIGMILYLAFALAGELVEWSVYPSRGALLLVAFILEVILITSGWLALGPSVTHPRSGRIVLICNVTICLIVALYNAAVHGDLLYVLFTFLAFMAFSSMFIPWGARYQLGLNGGVIVAYVIALVGGARVGPVPAYDVIAIVANTVLSALGAFYIDQYRRQRFAQAEALHEVNRKLEDAGRARTALLNGLSHDMRTPVSVIMGYVQMLSESTALPAELQQPTRSIRREAWELLHLVDGVMDLARLEAGHLPFQRSTFHLAAVLEPLRGTAEDLLRDSDLVLHWDIPTELILDSDAGKVREITRNLLSNAVKYTPHGEIRLTAVAVPLGIEIAVADTGVGIAEEDIGRIFDPFERIDDGPAPQPAGSGFGLYLVKLLVDMVGGQIEVQSHPTSGSTFRVRFPPHPPPSGR